MASRWMYLGVCASPPIAHNGAELAAVAGDEASPSSLAMGDREMEGSRGRLAIVDRVLDVSRMALHDCR